MMLQKIQNALININETVFQDLGDCYFYAKSGSCGTINRRGSQVGKQKTKKGTPDTSILLPNGKYILIEYSTNITKGVAKLLSDVSNCLDYSKTGILLNDIEKIIICFNFNLKSSEEQELLSQVSSSNIKLELYNLDTLSLDLKLNYRHLVNEYLDLPIDTGQIVSIDSFIQEYNNASKGISTPLDNLFLHREKELQELKDIILKEDLVVLYGAPGVGKTKLALETIKDFVKENPCYTAYCISYKNASLIEDLQRYMDFDKDYVLFVDDANRIDSIGQIIGFYKTSRRGKLKVVITVRDYAYSTIEKVCANLLHTSYTINVLTDEQIKDIVKAEPFCILNTRYHKEIVRIANGNPRIAIMVALLAIEKQDIYALYDLSDLFEKYFSTFVSDNGEFADDTNVKILGVIAFFYTLPYKDKDFVTDILNNFEIGDYASFIDHIDILEKLELIEIQYDYVKISEQNLSTYFFYKSFIKENLLSFEVLLNSYFIKNKHRFDDCIVPTCNTFGYENVRDKIKTSLVKYCKSILDDKELSLELLSVFGFFIPEETMKFIYDVIDCLPENDTSYYRIDNDNTHDNYLKQDKIIELLSGFYMYPGDNFTSSLELSFEYVRKQPQLLTELLNKIKSVLSINCNDEQTGFVRQNNLYRLLIDNVNKNDLLYIKAFYELSKLFLSFRFEHTEFGRNNTFTISYNTISCNKYINGLRKSIWDCICMNFTEDALQLLENYIKPTLKTVKEIIEYDIPFICLIIEKHFSSDSYLHCKFVQGYIRWCKNNKVTYHLFEYLSQKYINSTYELFLKISWDRYRDKCIYDFDNYKEYNKFKEEEIRKSIVFNDLEDVDTFYNDFLYITEIELTKNNEFNNYDKTLDVVVEQTFKNSFELGSHLLKLIMKNNTINYIPKLWQYTAQNNMEQIWETIQSEEMYVKKENWEISFYKCLSENLVCDKYIDAVKNTIAKWHSKYLINLDCLNGFINAYPSLLEELLGIIVKKIENGDEVHIDKFCFKETCIKLVDTNIKLFEKAYLQQIILQQYFDYENDIFIEILMKDPYFLIEYISALYLNDDTNSYSYNIHNLSVVWDLEDIEIILKELFNKVSEKYVHIFSNEHFCNSFFMNLPIEKKDRARNFLERYCNENYTDYRKVNIVVDIVRHTMKDIYNRILTSYVSLTQDVNLFSNIKWCASGGIYSGNVIIGDIQAAEWNNVLSVLNKSEIGYKLIPIKQYVNSQVEHCLETAEWERKRRFLSK